MAIRRITLREHNDTIHHTKINKTLTFKMVEMFQQIIKYLHLLFINEYPQDPQNTQSNTPHERLSG